MANEVRDPYSEYPHPNLSSGSPSSARFWLAVTAMVCGTMLLLCGGMIGLGFYAVDRWAETLADIMSEDDEPDVHTLAALEYSLAEDPTIQERVGKIEEVRVNDDLTYDWEAGDEDYFYTIIGEESEVTVVCQFTDDDQGWFDSLEVLDRPAVGAAKKPLVTRYAPFDTIWSQRVWEVLASDDAYLETLNVGDVKWIEYDYRKFDDKSPLAIPRLQFEITGTTGTTTVVGDFTSFEYEKLKALFMMNEDGSLGESFWNGG